MVGMVSRVPDDKRKWRAANYARLSRDDGCDGYSESIIGQQKIIEKWAASRPDVQLVASYTDDGYSGATFERPGFLQMIEDARAGMFNTIIVKDLSRFCRSYLDCGTWIERKLPKLGVRLYSISDDFDSMREWDYDMAILFPFKNLVNEMQVITTSQKVRASLEAKRQRGEFVRNFAPYGYVKDPQDKHKLVVDAEAAVVVVRIFADFIGGKPASRIARELNDEGIDPPSVHRKRLGQNNRTNFDSAKPPQWHAQTVLRILRDDVYTGLLVQGKTRKASWRAKQYMSVPPEQWARTPDAHEPLVSKAGFAAVQEKLGGA